MIIIDSHRAGPNLGWGCQTCLQDSEYHGYVLQRRKLWKRLLQRQRSFKITRLPLELPEGVLKTLTIVKRLVFGPRTQELVMKAIKTLLTEALTVPGWTSVLAPSFVSSPPWTPRVGRCDGAFRTIFKSSNLSKPPGRETSGFRPFK